MSSRRERPPGGDLSPSAQLAILEALENVRRLIDALLGGHRQPEDFVTNVRLIELWVALAAGLAGGHRSDPEPEHKRAAA